jgi:hypothetical protein
MKDGPLHLLRTEAPAPAEESPRVTYEQRAATGQEICQKCGRTVRAGRGAVVYIDVESRMPTCRFCAPRPRR